MFIILQRNRVGLVMTIDLFFFSLPICLTLDSRFIVEDEK